MVRVARDGSAVIAGRSTPHAEVTVRDGDRTIGTAKADRRGEWVVLPGTPLSPGSRELAVEARDSSGRIAAADRIVVVAVPEPSSRPETPSPGALAVAIPREGTEPSRVLQRPDAAPSDSPQDSARRPAQPPSFPPTARPQAEVTGGTEPDADPAQPRRTTQEQGEAFTAPGSTVPRPAAPTPSAAVFGAPSAGHPSSDGPSPDRRSPGTAAPGLAVDTVDYDQGGKVAFSGTASPGSTVKVFVNDRALGQAQADPRGRWELSPEADVAPGEYTLRADEVRPPGTVTGRVRLPFARVDPGISLPEGARIVVQPGNSLWRIARRTYGGGVRYTYIYQANRNQIRNPDLIYPGQILSLPQAP